MMHAPPPPALPLLQPGQAFPPVERAWTAETSAPGLLAAGGDLTVPSLLAAYRRGIFPWFSQGQPVLWWSTSPRMVLPAARFRLHRSLRKTLQAFMTTPGCALRFDSAFDLVIRACASTPRAGQSGSWIVPEMVAAYEALHAAGHAHSVETWVGDELVGGLYCVSIGQMVFGESMFARRANASKIALAALVAFCRAHGLPLIDCQQETPHLALLGAAPMPRQDFVRQVAALTAQPTPPWRFARSLWAQVLPGTGAAHGVAQ